jgi:hypothetical protein
VEGFLVSRDVIARYLADNLVRKAVVPEIMTASRRIENIADLMEDGKNPEMIPQWLEEIKDACVSIRVYAEKLP